MSTVLSCPEDPAVRGRLTECLETILNKAQEPPKSKKVQHSNAKNAVLFEAISLIIHHDRCVGCLWRGFVSRAHTCSFSLARDWADHVWFVHSMGLPFVLPLWRGFVSRAHTRSFSLARDWADHVWFVHSMGLPFVLPLCSLPDAFFLSVQPGPSCSELTVDCFADCGLIPREGLFLLPLSIPTPDWLLV